MAYMAVYKRNEKSKYYTMDFLFQGRRVYESTGVRTKQLAEKVERDRILALEEGRAGIKKPVKPKSFAEIADQYLEDEEAGLAPGMTRGKAATVRIDRFNLTHLKKFFGEKLLPDITPRDMKDYQQMRLRQGAAPKTINLEIGTFRSITSETGDWARLIKRFDNLEVNTEIGRCLTIPETDAILQACLESGSRLLYPMVVLQLETGSRSGTVIRLPWSEVDFRGRGLRWGRDKTAAGSGRTVPISERAWSVLEMWAENFPERESHHFVFPSEIYRQTKGGGIKVYTDPTKHVRSVQHSWVTALERAAWILAGRPDSMVGIKPIVCRFHDLRHTACTRMIQSGVPIPVVAQLVGWSPSTMWEMAARYGHFSQESLRTAVETISAGASRHKSRHLNDTPVFHVM